MKIYQPDCVVRKVLGRNKLTFQPIHAYNQLPTLLYLVLAARRPHGGALIIYLNLFFKDEETTLSF